jgi:hypothetical protein
MIGINDYMTINVKAYNNIYHYFVEIELYTKNVNICINPYSMSMEVAS